MTEYTDDSLAHYAKPVISTPSQRIILLATQNITTKTLYNNGLLQNIIILYSLFELLGYKPYFLVYSLPTLENSDVMVKGNYRCILPEEILGNPIPIHMYIEVGMSIEHKFITFLKDHGAKIVKLYFGNTLNIDVENITKSRYVDFPHHSYNFLDEIWTSPHYLQNLDYLCALYRIPLAKGKTAPYLWDPLFLRNTTYYTPSKDWTTTSIVIAEPNISHQKFALLPLVLANDFAKKHPEWKGRIVCMNSGLFKSNMYFQSIVLPNLEIVRDNRVDFLERQTIHELMKNNPHSVFLGHQWNNEYNYMTLELMNNGFPILHNSSAWKDYGYYWSHEEWPEALATLYKALRSHQEFSAIYKNHSKLLAWNFSIFNPDVQKYWLSLLE